MTEPEHPRERAFQGLSAHGFHRVVYWQWGDPANDRVVVCVHGLTRNGRDFDALARALAPRVRVACPDMPGRGRSDWLRHAGDYAAPTYLATLAALLARLDAREVSWVGTSMGGLLGMLLAAQPGTPIARLVVNDVGPVIEADALERIAGYVGLAPAFPSYAALEAHVRAVCAPFGALSDEQWRHLAGTSAREQPDGTWRLAYDPAIGQALRAAGTRPADLWSVWDAIACPTLVLRGERSDLLSVETARAMRGRGPRPEVIEFPGIGHAPPLLDPGQIGPVRDFLVGAG